ncbi:5-formyltetrahydrofolate cyclo-ligase [Pikeienuella piscinae]|uniref:5-formyltetrahydrofolate cyclo-ligase n=1 Tax=Pikeienuella piscinae TaxID=2748098 RepID=A0A7L5BYF8_9RHOB|nr:5-formyltetrahydrofolate cyclo-ligase [Pikeienuella piscinae]QIE54924.1 5-formyltetrahydrofolate cyclo-ligase [Pikeienuella piscinae]
MALPTDDGEGSRNSPASPPCSASEADPTYMGLDATSARAGVMRWRKGERAKLIDYRLAIPAETRAGHSRQIAASLNERVGDPAGHVFGFYWPFRGEPDLRQWMETLIERGGVCTLPVVIEKGAPLVFRPWRPGCAMTRGVWNIPIPAEGPEVTPDIVISPVVGFDPGRYRLGYGGGFYDRTLAGMAEKPRVFGVGYSGQALATIHPQPHDIPMDEIITETGRAF